MIKKETIKKTRDFLNTVRTNLSLINRGHATISDIAAAMEISRGRFGAAHELRLFEVKGRNGSRMLYRCNVPYINETMAEEVIRCEYDAAARQRHAPGSVELSDEERRSIPKGVTAFNESLLNNITRWLRDNKFEGIIYRHADGGNVKVVL